MPGILFMDDNAKIGQLLHSFIEGNTGYEICGEAENGAQVLERAKKIRSSSLITNIHV
jgi:YesN/AraC family two-component response regulator